MTPVCSLPWQCVLTVTFHAHDYYVNRLKHQKEELLIAIHIGSVMRNWWHISVRRALRSGMASKYNNNHLAYWKMISIRRLSKSSTSHCTQQRISKSRRYKYTPAGTLWLYLVNLKTQKREDFKIDYRVRWAWFIEIDDYWWITRLLLRIDLVCTYCILTLYDLCRGRVGIEPWVILN